MIRSPEYWPSWDRRPWPASARASSLAQGKLSIIDSAGGEVRLSCDVCGSHVVCDRAIVGQPALCPVCGELRETERRPSLGQPPLFFPASA